MQLTINKVTNGYILQYTQDQRSLVEIYTTYAALEEAIKELLVSPPTL